LTLTHNKNIENDLLTELKNEWDWFVQSDIKTWLEFNDYWIKMAQSGISQAQNPDNKEIKDTLPVYFFRFEDLITNPY